MTTLNIIQDTGFYPNCILTSKMEGVPLDHQTACAGDHDQKPRGAGALERRGAKETE